MGTRDNYSIKDLEKLSGIKAHTIRIWEKRYNIIKPKRTDTNIRYYCDEDLKQILNISLLNKNGFKISSIAQMSATELSSHLLSITLNKEKLEGVHESLLLSLIEMNEVKFNNAFTSAQMKLGMEKAFVNIIFPFFERIGFMWQAGSISPAQEHFFTHLIRQKLITATDLLQVNTQEGSKSVLLFLPENELHEIGLLFYNYALKARGYKTIYLGQSVPLTGLEDVISISQPDYIITSMTTSINQIHVKDFVQRLIDAAPNKTIFFTGPIVQTLDKEISKNMLTTEELKFLLNMQ
jgi:DNA-binding transcriptional MerR regulator